MAQRILDFRSDTVTQPTQAMRRAMAEAIVGDAVLGEDPTVRALEAMAAAMCGKDAALFVVSGTMANQIAVMALAQPSDEIIVGEDAHIYNLEAGGLAALAGVQARPLRADRGQFLAADVARAIRVKGIQSAITRVLCLENTYDLNRGIPLPLAYLQEMADVAHRRDVGVYLDGARIFNAALVFDLPLAQLCAPVDCLQFCLSKGLAAPFGALLVGGRAFIERSRWIRQRIGGGMRQAGHMAAAGIVALDQMLPRLAEDHDNARRLAAGLAALDERLIERGALLTNIVHIDFGAAGRESGAMVMALADNGIRIKQIDVRSARMVTHLGIASADIDTALAVFERCLA